MDLQPHLLNCLDLPVISGTKISTELKSTVVSNQLWMTALLKRRLMPLSLRSLPSTTMSVTALQRVVYLELAPW